MTRETITMEIATPIACAAPAAAGRERGPASASSPAVDGSGELALLRSLVENATDIIYVVSTGAVIRWVGPTLERVLGYTADRLIGRSMLELVHPDDASNLLGRFGRLVQQMHGSDNFEYRARGANGEWRTFEAHARNLLHDPAVGGVLITARDVTARRQAEEAQQRLTTVLEATTDFVGTADPHGRLLYLNREGRRILGLAPASPLPPLTIHDLHPGWATEILLREGIPTALRQGAWRGETALVGAHGEVPVSQVLIAHTSTDGRPQFFSMILRDISEHKAAERALRLSEERFRRVVDSMDDIVFTLDLEQRHTGVYGRWLEKYGLDASKYLGRRADEIMEADAASVHMIANERALSGEGVVYEWTMEHEGKRSFVQTSLSALRDGTGAVIGVVGVGRDLTERRQLEEQLRQAQKMEAIGRLAGGIAHDFNNLLTAIQGHAELVMEDLTQASAVRQELSEIHTAATRAASLTRQLLAFSRRQVLQPRVVDLNACVGDIEKMLRRLIGEDIQLVTSLEPSLYSVVADGGQLEQVLLNLAVNARDAMPHGGRLTIQTRNVYSALEVGGAPVPAPGVLLTVTDTGIGMSEEVRLRIFEPFFTTKERGKGTGLGLSTVYGIVTQSGGRLDVQSTPHRGSTFRIYLPAVEGAVHLEDEPVRPRVPDGCETVLVVEDEPAVRSLVRRILQRKGYRVIEASGADEALREAAQLEEEIHLLLTDIIMPGINGSQMADMLVRERPAMRVLFMSGYTNDVVLRHRGLSLDVPLLEKPFSADVLAAKVREVLDAE